MEEIPIEKIKVLENIRTRISKTELVPLMDSIKQVGLLHPIGVWKDQDKYVLSYGHRRLEAFKKLGRGFIPATVHEEKMNDESFIERNTAENIHREQITPTEFAGVCNKLKDKGLSISEIASRLSVSKSKIDTALKLGFRIPKEFKEHIGYANGGTGKITPGKIPVTTANAIISIRTTKSNIREILESAKKEELTKYDIDLIDRLIRNGLSAKEAIKQRKKYISTHVDFVINKKMMEELRKQYGTSTIQTLKNMFLGKIPLEKDLIFRG